jgi:hypothetical protein
MPDELTIFKDQILDNAQRLGFTIFYGAYPDNLPAMSWNGDLEPDPVRFLQLAKSLNARLLYVNWVTFTPADIDEKILQGEDLSDAQTDWLNDHNSRLEEFRQYVNQIASARAGFFLDGVFHFYERVFDWYQNFGNLINEEMPDA